MNQKIIGDGVFLDYSNANHTVVKIAWVLKKEDAPAALTQFSRSVLPVSGFCGSSGFLPAKPSSSVCQ